MALLDKSNIPEVASHIRNLKDVVELKLTGNPGYNPSDKADGYNDVQAAQYVCPVTGLEMSGRYRYISAVFSMHCRLVSGPWQEGGESILVQLLHYVQ